jgi:hypothetical protein
MCGTTNIKFIIYPFANRGRSRRLTWSASGDERGNLKVLNTKSLEWMKCARRDFRRPHKQKKKTKLCKFNYNLKIFLLYSYVLTTQRLTIMGSKNDILEARARCLAVLVVVVVIVVVVVEVVVYV